MGEEEHLKKQAAFDEIERLEELERRANVEKVKAQLRPAIDEAIKDTGKFAHVVQALFDIVADFAIKHVIYKGDPVDWALFMAGTFLQRRKGEACNKSSRIN